ncbi:DUF4362 domain-containing protein [Guptibacillus algicola]|uniref:DUF4362 domain-containing protein n=1 Tax=Guptibacillus algicola TaxID=225844 RepID=UPI001CD589E7|nr:DUF4362 domain-containing protein [Alkalihalobacillus algicola]MCA0985674.1 DUF4362 domain-containing protein [Alkalihalobacillus algicola]
MKKILFILLSSILLGGCSFTPSNSDIVIGLGSEITNLDTFELFLENVNGGKTDRIRIVSYTDEGDPIIKDVSYDGSSIYAETDTTRDKFGPSRVESITCKSIESKVTVTSEKSEEYFLSGCEPSELGGNFGSHLLTKYEGSS